MAATRDLIVVAAVDTYRERGVAGATIGAIAARADVSRGTVLHHFGGADGLLDAVLDHILETIEVPDERVLEGAATERERIHRFVAAQAHFNERSNSWWEVFRRDMDRPIVKAKEQVFWAAFGRLRAAAIGPAADDRIVASTVGALVHPGTLFTFRDVGLSLDETIDAIADLVAGVVQRYREAGE